MLHTFVASPVMSAGMNSFIMVGAQVKMKFQIDSPNTRHEFLCKF